MRNLQEQVEKAFCYQKLFWPFTVWINCSGDLKIFENSRPSASNFKSFSRSLEQFFLTVGQNNFGNKIPEITRTIYSSSFHTNFQLVTEGNDADHLAISFNKVTWYLLILTRVISTLVSTAFKIYFRNSHWAGFNQEKKSEN